MELLFIRKDIQYILGRGLSTEIDRMADKWVV